MFACAKDAEFAQYQTNAPGSKEYRTKARSGSTSLEKKYGGSHAIFRELLCLAAQIYLDHKRQADWG
ncbi:hypothetical protein E4U53_006875 [Claviceps sorghi]|nr:hypothetical protein E4U53_006875 [Claviceps sorghi]